MRKALSTLVLTTLLGITVWGMPAAAAPIDDVKAKVNAIKSDTNAIKSRTGSILSQVQGVRNTVTAQVAEVAEVKTALDKLQSMRTRFEEVGIDPAELLEMIPLEELRAAMDEVKQNRAALQEMLNDPGIETFRAQLLETLAGINRVVTEGRAPEVTPFQTLVEKAPRPLIAVLKAASGTAFEPLQESVSSTVESLEELRAMGLLTASSRPAVDRESGFRRVARTSPTALALTDDQAATCAAIASFGIERVYSILWTFQNNMLKLKKNHVWISSRTHQLLRKVFPKLPNIGIHGYLTLRLSGIELDSNYQALNENQLHQLDAALELNDHRLRKIEWMDSRGTVEGFCEREGATAGLGGPARQDRDAPSPTWPASTGSPIGVF